jgi:hypothetical protein
MEHFHRTLLNEFYRVTCRREIYAIIKQLQPTWTCGSPRSYERTRAPGRRLEMASLLPGFTV